MTTERLKELYPVYPSFNKVQRDGAVEFQSLVRFNRKGNWYIVLVKQKYLLTTSGYVPESLIHGFHEEINNLKLLFVVPEEGYYTLADGTRLNVLDDDQTPEDERLAKLYRMP